MGEQIAESQTVAKGPQPGAAIVTKLEADGIRITEFIPTLVITQANYDAIGTKDVDLLYLIVG